MLYLCKPQGGASVCSFIERRGKENVKFQIQHYAYLHLKKHFSTTNQQRLASG